MQLLKGLTWDSLFQCVVFVWVCLHIPFSQKTFFGAMFQHLASVLRKWVPERKERRRKIVEGNIRWSRRRRAKPKQGSVHRNAVQLCRDSQFGRAGVRADWVDSL